MKEFYEVTQYFPKRIKQALHTIPDEIKNLLFEIRVREDKPISLVLIDKTVFLNTDGTLSNGISLKALSATKEEMKEIFTMICRYSVHSFEKEISEGFITLNGGHRVGICGTSVNQNGEVVSLREITSFNFRIARNVLGVSKDFVDRFYENSLPSTLVYGAPMSGKTTFLRDVITKLSLKQIKVSVIDERSEFGESLGPCTDRFCGYPKGIGMEIALRTMSPQIIVIDEIGDFKEVEAIKQSINSGVSIIASAHADNFNELCLRPQINSLIKDGVFNYIVELSNKSEIKRIIDYGRIKC